MSEEEKLAFLLMVFYLLEQRRQATSQRLILYAFIAHIRFKGNNAIHILSSVTIVF